MVFVFVFVSVCLFAFCLFYVSLHQKNVTLKFQYIFQVLTGSEEIIYNTVRETLKVPIWKISDLYPLRTRTQYQASEPCYTKYSAQKPAICQTTRAWFYLLLPLRSLRMLQAQWICLRRPCLPKPLPSCPSFFWLRELVKPTSCLKRKVVVLDESADVAAFFDFQDLKSRRIDRFQSPMITSAFVGTGASSS